MEFSPDSTHALEILVRLGAAAILGGVLGLERERQQKPAGLRTHMMVALGAACFSLAALGMERAARDGWTGEIRVVTDPTRVVQGIVGGIGFLGAGAILRDHGQVEGLTTAGSIWLVGAVGIAAGAGNYVLAALASILALVILWLIGHAEHRWAERRAQTERQRPTDGESPPGNGGGGGM